MEFLDQTTKEHMDHGSEFKACWILSKLRICQHRAIAQMSDLVIENPKPTGIQCISIEREMTDCLA